MEDSIQSVLILDKLVYDEFNFKRLGFKNDNNLDLDLNGNYGKLEDSDRYRVKLLVEGKKKDEYTLSVGISGFFRVNPNVDKELEKELISRNAVAILLPYLRSEVSILTSQPEMDSVILPIVDVSKF